MTNEDKPTTVITNTDKVTSSITNTSRDGIEGFFSSWTYPFQHVFPFILLSSSQITNISKP